jgi:hypothetical protein
LPERCTHPLGHDPGGGIGRSARRERHHQRDGARGGASAGVAPKRIKNDSAVQNLFMTLPPVC